MKLIMYLDKLIENRASLAALKRSGCEPWNDMDVVRLISRFSNNRGDWASKVPYIIAMLFSLNPSNGGKGDFGNSIKRLYSLQKTGGAEKRFLRLLDSQGDGLIENLRSLVRLCKDKRVSINWENLYFDLIDWENTSKKIPIKWAISFYSED